MRLHCVSLPHTHTTREFSWCAYSEKVRKFATMMTGRGHTVYLYGTGQNEAECAEHVVCIAGPDTAAPTSPEWSEATFGAMNESAIAAIAERIEPRDFLCLIGGHPQEPIAQAFPNHISVEYGVGYEGVFADYRVFESYAWMHTIYGVLYGGHSADGRFYDAVIPNYFEVDQFPAGNGGGGYLLYLGRLIDRKGIGVAVDTADRAGLPLVVAGYGDYDLPDWVEHVGPVGPSERAELLQDATALIAPTLYVEPFGGTAVEAQLCGTPAITTDWGAFTETVEHGTTGYRCRTLQEFVVAAQNACRLPRGLIRKRAVRRYSTAAVAPQYEQYFDRLLGLWDGGFYAERQAAVA